MAIFSVCSTPGCNELTETVGLCQKCTIKKKPNPTGEKSPTVLKWMNSARFRNRRKSWITGKCCAICRDEGRPLARATVLEHKIAHQGDYDLFWDEDNWQPACKSCANRKTASQDGGFGNIRRG